MWRAVDASHYWEGTTKCFAFESHGYIQIYMIFDFLDIRSYLCQSNYSVKFWLADAVIQQGCCVQLFKRFNVHAAKKRYVVILIRLLTLST